MDEGVVVGWLVGLMTGLAASILSVCVCVCVCEMCLPVSASSSGHVGTTRVLQSQLDLK